jgi:homoserine kinase type II
MAVYTDVTDEELAGFLAAYDVGSAISFKGIAEGVENSNFMLETQSGRFILTVYERRVDGGDLPFFLGLMQWLASRDYPSAAPIANREGETLGRLRDKPFCLVFRCAGRRRPTAGKRARGWDGCTTPPRATTALAATHSASRPGRRFSGRSPALRNG